MSNLHFETISIKQQELLEKLGSLGTLVGGTALSLQIGHRKSYDLDFAIQSKISDNLLSDIQDTLKEFELSQRLSSDTQYTAFTNDVKITFFQDAAPFLHESRKIEKFQLADLHDIFSSKLYVMGRRATWRDYVDVAVCLDRKVCDLQQGVKESVERYKINERWILDPLTYFKDLEITPIEWVGKKCSQEQIKEIITKNVENYLP